MEICYKKLQAKENQYTGRSNSRDIIRQQYNRAGYKFCKVGIQAEKNKKTYICENVDSFFNKRLVEYTVKVNIITRDIERE